MTSRRLAAWRQFPPPPGLSHDDCLDSAVACYWKNRPPRQVLTARRDPALNVLLVERFGPLLELEAERHLIPVGLIGCDLDPLPSVIDRRAVA